MNKKIETVLKTIIAVLIVILISLGINFLFEQQKIVYTEPLNTLSNYYLPKDDTETLKLSIYPNLGFVKSEIYTLDENGEKNKIIYKEKSKINHKTGNAIRKIDKKLRLDENFSLNYSEYLKNIHYLTIKGKENKEVYEYATNYFNNMLEEKTLIIPREALEALAHFNEEIKTKYSQDELDFALKEEFAFLVSHNYYKDIEINDNTVNVTIYEFQKEYWDNFLISYKPLNSNEIVYGSFKDEKWIESKEKSEYFVEKEKENSEKVMNYEFEYLYDIENM